MRQRRDWGERIGSAYLHSPAQGDPSPSHELFVGENRGNLAAFHNPHRGHFHRQLTLPRILWADFPFQHDFVLRPRGQHQDGEHAVGPEEWQVSSRLGSRENKQVQKNADETANAEEVKERCLRLPVLPIALSMEGDRNSLLLPLTQNEVLRFDREAAVSVGALQERQGDHMNDSPTCRALWGMAAMGDAPSVSAARRCCLRSSGAESACWSFPTVLQGRRSAETQENIKRFASKLSRG